MAVGKQCERCGMDNPATNNFCGQCGAALPALPIRVAEEEPQAKIGNDQTEAVITPVGTVPAGARDAASVPQRPSTRPAAEDELPDWLRDLNAFQQEQPLPRPLPATAASTPDAPTEVVAATQHDLPAWLRADVEELPAPPTSGTSPEDVPALPAWLTNDPDITPTSAQVANGGEPPTEPARVSDAARSSMAASAGIPSWLIESPDVAANPPADVAPSSSEAETSMSSLPRWLLDDDEDDLPLPAPMSVADDNTTATQPPEDTLPAWLRDTQPMQVSDGVAVVGQSDENTLPAWLRDPQPAQESDDTAPSWVQAEALRQEPPINAASGSDDEIGGARTYEFQSTAETSSPAMEIPSSTPRLPDWLLDPDPTPGPGSETVPGQGPNWLSGTPTEHDEPTLPDWLRSQEGAPAPAPVSTSALPSWLLDPPPDAAVPEAAPRGEQPDWLQMLGQADANNAVDSLITPGSARTEATSIRYGSTSPTTTDVTQPSRSTNAGSADEPKLPDWLLPTPEEAMAAQPGPVEPEDDVPAWLRDFTTTPQPVAEQDAEPRPLDQWLTDTGPEPPSFAALPIPVSEESRARIYDVRDEETEIDAASPREVSPALPSWLVGKNNQTGEEPWALPPWLSEADTTQDKATLAAIGSNDASAKVYDLPSWLQEDEATAAAIAPSHASSVPSWLEEENAAPASIRAVEPVQAQRVIEIPAPTTEERVAASSMLERLGAEPEPEPAAIAEAPPVRRSSIWLSTIIPLIAFLLIVAAIVYVLLFGPGLPSIFGSLLSPSLASATPVLQRTQAVSPGVAQWQEQLTQLSPQTPVLLAYATDGSRGAELAALEEGLVGQLQARSMPIVLMATDPQGAVLSRQRAETTSSDAPMLDLGFKPGGVVAVARVANNVSSVFGQTANGRDLSGDADTLRTFCGIADGPVADCSLDRFGMVVVLADEPDDARSWVEQIGSVYPNLPLVFAVPAETAPHVRPYLLFGQTTMLVGLNDAVALGTLEGETSSMLARQSDAVAAGSAVWGIAALIGAIPAMLAGWLRRRKRQGDLWQR